MDRTVQDTIILIDEDQEERRTSLLRSRNFTETEKRKGTGLNSIDVRNLKGNIFIPQMNESTIHRDQFFTNGFYSLTDDEEDIINGLGDVKFI